MILTVNTKLILSNNNHNHSLYTIYTEMDNIAVYVAYSK